MRRIASAALAALLLVVAPVRLAAAEVASGTWVRLTDCRYVDAEGNDGDSFHVRCGVGDFIVRLYFVDTPETDLRYPERVREQSRHFGISTDAAMRVGHEASAATREALRQPFLVWTRWASAQGRSKLPRYYAFVETNRSDLAESLVARGLARTKGATARHPAGESARARLQRLRAIEAQARVERRGAWATAGQKPAR
ncbi:MAG: thermonuclease family protein [Burkholderiales bacterium]|jgi:endonuclease YncB( thermonuclease family)|nr:thermonuclease family protein [Burkholderiales bacterium]